jgi:hypothetical protein
MKPAIRIPALAGSFAFLALSAGSARSANLSREYWKNITGSTVASLTSNANYPTKPTGTDALTQLEGPQNWGDNYGARVRGYLLPPTTGNYIFWIASDDQSQLFLSTTDLPSNKALIAQVSTGSTTFRQWTKYASQKSATIALTAGKRYYFEVLHKEGTGGDHFSVGWQLPSGAQERPIPNSRLQPFSTVTLTASATQVAEGSTARTTFTVTRTGDVSKALTVNFTYAGTANLGSDYYLADLSAATTILKSNLFNGDADALTIANGGTTVTVPNSPSGALEDYQAIDSWWRIKWKIARAYLLLGYERKGFPFGKVINAAEMKALDARVYAAERTMVRQSARLGNFHGTAAPDFWNNLTQDYIGSSLAAIFDLFNAGATKYQAFTTDCVLANYIPHMCGQMAHFGTVSGASCRDVGPSDILPANQLKVRARTFSDTPAAATSWARTNCPSTP